MAKIKTTIGETILELRDLKETYGHDDSIPFNANVYIDGEHIGNAWNDGWGGDSCLDCKTNAAKERADKLDEYIKKNYTMTYGKMSWEMTLLQAIDYLVCYGLDGRKTLRLEQLEGCQKVAA